MARAHAAGVVAVVNVATDLAGLRKGLRYPNLAAAIPPHDVEEANLVDYFTEIELFCDRLIAIGETGLDSHGPLEPQIVWLKRHIQLAKTVHLPLVIHCRGCFEPLFRVFDEEKWTGPFQLHCFTGTLSEAQEVVARGGFVSFSGIITFKKSEELRAIAQALPPTRVVVETDAPWLAPVPFRGKPCEPSMLVHTAKAVGISAEQLTANTLSLFPKIQLD